MKHSITTCLMIFSFALFTNAQNNYDTLWAEVLKLESEGLTKSASENVNLISKRAKKEGNKTQIIKALLHQSKYLLILEEDAQLSIVNNFKTEIENADTITKHILENMLATMYWQYFQQNRWKFRQRTETATKIDTTDFRTWDLETLFNDIHLYYQRSLQNPLLLQQESVSKYDVLLSKFKDSEIYRPTLYDILAHNALEFYKTDENSITKPAYKFTIDNANYFDIYSTFSNSSITSKDSTALQLQALKIYKSLMRSHFSSKNTEAKTQINIERLKFVHNKSVLQNKDELLIKTLELEKETINNHPSSTLYAYEIANQYRKIGNQFDAKLKASKANTDKRWLLKKAIEICDASINTFPESEGAKNCKILKQQILRPNINLSAERFIPVNTSSKVLVNTKNIDTVTFKIYKLNKQQHSKFQKLYRVNAIETFLKNLTPSKQWLSTLKNDTDYQGHSQEIEIPKLDNGLYVITANTNVSDTVFSAAEIQVTNLALVERKIDHTNTYQVINRTNGKPVENASVKITHAKRNNKQTLLKNKVSDRFGRFIIKQSNTTYRNIKIEVNYNNETAYFGNYYSYKNYNTTENKNTIYRANIFTDRSIYRPGQTVYFKGILTQTYDKNTSILTDEIVDVSLRNVNGETLSELQLKSNTYGSVQSTFVLPNGGLTGNYSIIVKLKNKQIASQYFSVEEYKRPKFEVEFPPITDTFKVNDSITVKGLAKAYAGSSISDAKVVYRVKRNVQYPRWYYWQRPYNNYGSEGQEITFGEEQTNAKGEFEITFKALPDLSVDKANKPIFNYEITADITDINGETRSQTTIVNVGYHSMTAEIIAPNTIDISSKTSEITIDTKNLNGETVSSKGTIKIYKLTPPKYVLRKRPWEAPDYQTWTEAEFKTRFPNEAYTNEDKMINWKKGKLVFETTYDTETSKTIVLNKIKRWQHGKYIIELEAKDNFNQDIKAKAFVSLVDPKAKTVADQQRFTIKTDKSSYTTSGSALITIGSAAKDLTVTLDIEKQGKIVDTKIITLNNELKTISIPITKTDLGGFNVNYSYAFKNDYTYSELPIAIPYPKTDLQIETTTFRDKLQPRQNETWSFKIKGPKGEKVAAELLASMYDVSLDQFKTHQWQFKPIVKPTYYSQAHSSANQSFGVADFRRFNTFKNIPNIKRKTFDQWNWFGFTLGNNYSRRLRGRVNGLIQEAPMQSLEEHLIITEDEMGNFSVRETNLGIDYDSISFDLKSKKALIYSKVVGQSGGTIIAEKTKKEASDFDNIQIRKNLQETAFFFPQLQTDKDGNVSFSFTSPEALTQWKLQLLAHTKTLESTVTQFEAVTQKELMVIPNAPRFLREGDQITISTKIANISDKDLEGIAKLELTDAITGKDITSSLVRSSTSTTLSTGSVETFLVSEKGNTQVTWNLKIPENIQAVQYKIIAKAGDFSDGEQNVLPVLSNRMLVTESLPMWIGTNQTKTFTLDKLKNNTSITLKNHKLTLEITSNPAWYAVQALPYLMEYPYDCNEQTFSRYYANALAQHIVKSNPKIEAVFNQWKSTNSDALLSNLEKNQELKSLLIEETPWLRDAQSETEQKKRIALLFDLNQMTNELDAALQKLTSNQNSSGAWAWFNGGRDNRYITQHIIAGFGHLKQLSVTSSAVEMSMVKQALNYLDQQFVKTYKDLKKYNKDIDLNKDHLSYIQLHYLYVRSFYPELEPSKETQTIINYYKSQIQKYWLKRSLYAKGLMALTMHRMNDENTAKKILKSLEENSITSEELGVYWKENTNSWYWHQAPIETQALLIEAFSEAGHVIQSEAKNLKTIDNLKIWLLKNKQTNRWKTTKATTEAVYALLLQGSDWLSVTDAVTVKVGNENIDPSKLDNVKTEAGTGYLKTTWNGSEIQPEQANVTLTKKGEGIAWGAMYWQYFEDLDKITSAETPLKLSKKLFLKTNTANGKQLSEITTETKLNVGDLVTVRIELRSDRAMEFVHLKDMRAAGFEPINVLSQYKWQDGLGYYESTRDAATNFFIDYLPKGIFVFEYDVRVNNAGNMSNGISTIQSMYAPEFSSHSEGVRVLVD